MMFEYPFNLSLYLHKYTFNFIVVNIIFMNMYINKYTESSNNIINDHSQNYSFTFNSLTINLFT